jgi:hypothetical protein
MMMDGGEHIVGQIVTRDETCVYYYDALSNREAKVWALKDEEPTKWRRKSFILKRLCMPYSSDQQVG